MNAATLRQEERAETPYSARHLAIEDVSLVYETSRGPLKALDSLGFELAAGEFVSVLGPSGSGKSTLLKLVSGLLRPTSGRITLAAAEVTGPPPDVGIVFQQPTLLPWRNVLNNVLVPIRAMGRPVGQYRDAALELLKLVGLAEFAQHSPHELSGGMQQRVGLAGSSMTPSSCSWTSPSRRLMP